MKNGAVVVAKMTLTSVHKGIIQMSNRQDKVSFLSSAVAVDHQSTDGQEG